MNSSPLNYVDYLKRKDRSNSEKELQNICSKLKNFSETVKNSIKIEDFNEIQSLDNFEEIIKNICSKIDLSSKVVDQRLSDIIDIQHQKNIAFLYLWSTLNDIFPLRFKITKEKISILNRVKRREDIKYEEFGDYVKDISNRGIFYIIIRKLLDIVEKANFKDNSLQQRAEEHLLDFFNLLFEKDYRPVDSEYSIPKKFRKCRFKRNKHPLIHGSVFKSEEIDNKAINDIKELIEMLLYLN